MEDVFLHTRSDVREKKKKKVSGFTDMNMAAALDSAVDCFAVEFLKWDEGVIAGSSRPSPHQEHWLKK